MDQANNKKSTQPLLRKQWSFSSSVIMMSSADIVFIITMFLEMMIAVRYVSTENYGIFILMATITNLLVMFIDFGFKTTITQMLASKSENEQIEIFNNIFFSRCIIIFVLLLLFLFGKKLLNFFDLSKDILNYYMYIPIMVAAQSLDELCMSAIQGCHAYHISALSWASRSIIRLGFTFIFLHFFRLDLLGLVYSYIISFGLSAGFQYFFIPITKKISLSFSVIKKILKFSFPIQVARFCWFVSNRISTLLLAFYVGPINVAYYGIAERIPKAFQNIYASFISVFFPNMATFFANNKNDKASDTLNQSLRLFSFLMALSSLIIILFGKQIIILLFTDKYNASAPVFSLLMVAIHMGLLVQIMGYTLTSAGYPTRSLIENAFRAGNVVIFSFLLIPKYSITGAAIAILIANYLSNPLAIRLLKISKISVQNSKYLIQTLMLWLCAIAYHTLQLNAVFLKIVILIVFITINILLSTITLKDLNLIISTKLLEQVRHFFKRKKVLV